MEDIIFLCDGKDPECDPGRCYLYSGTDLYGGESRLTCYYTKKIEHAINFKPIKQEPGDSKPTYVELSKEDVSNVFEQLRR